MNTVYTFTDEFSSVKYYLMNLNNNPDYTVEYNGGKKFTITYNGGYNGVYDYTCEVIVSFKETIADLFHYWTFEVKSDEHASTIDVEEMYNPLGFLDFFIDDHIKTVGNQRCSDESFG